MAKPLTNCPPLCSLPSAASLPRVVPQGIGPQVLDDALVGETAQVSTGPRPHSQDAPILITNANEGLRRPTSTILLDPGQLGSHNYLKKVRLVVSSLRLGAPHSSSQNHCTGVDRHILYPAGRENSGEAVPCLGPTPSCPLSRSPLGLSPSVPAPAPTCAPVHLPPPPECPPTPPAHAQCPRSSSPLLPAMLR